MKFSLSQLWGSCGIPFAELSISLPAPVYGKRELFLSFPGELETVRFLVVPHVLPDRTITVWGMFCEKKRAPNDAPELRRIPPRRFFRTDVYARDCRLRL